ncbi:hypothetical protein BY458DRAFT_552822 [Sporodiniella umbellata]|nr:hypothetical protein BY458DRAFT_552822 [Sporodiniella umbellata]
MKDDYSQTSRVMLRDQELYSSLFLEQELKDSCLKRSFEDMLSIDEEPTAANKSQTSEESQEKSRRKEQNRAAQRAFRERKERHVKELEKRFKQFQDKHTLAIQQLIQENQYLRSVICRLEVENCVLKGTPVQSMEEVSRVLERARTALPLPPPPSHAAFQLSFQPPLPPLQIRPSSQMEAATVKKKEPTEPAQTTPRDFTFSISTPDTLRAHTPHKERHQHFPAVQLYPDHRHPVHLMRQDRLEKNVSPPPPPSDLESFLKPFLDTHEAIRTQDTPTHSTPPERKPARRRQHTSKIWQRVSQHASNPKFSVNQLLHAVKKSTLLADERLVLDEWDMEQMLQDF